MVCGGLKVVCRGRRRLWGSARCLRESVKICGSLWESAGVSGGSVGVCGSCWGCLGVGAARCSCGVSVDGGVGGEGCAAGGAGRLRACEAPRGPV